MSDSRLLREMDGSDHVYHDRPEVFRPPGSEYAYGVIEAVGGWFLPGQRYHFDSGVGLVKLTWTRNWRGREAGWKFVDFILPYGDSPDYKRPEGEEAEAVAHFQLIDSDTAFLPYGEMRDRARYGLLTPMPDKAGKYYCSTSLFEPEGSTFAYGLACADDGAFTSVYHDDLQVDLVRVRATKIFHEPYGHFIVNEIFHEAVVGPEDLDEGARAAVEYFGIAPREHEGGQVPEADGLPAGWED